MIKDFGHFLSVQVVILTYGDRKWLDDHLPDEVIIDEVIYKRDRI